jgi:hypothetical protein
MANQSEHTSSCNTEYRPTQLLYYHYHHIFVMDLGHLLTPSGLTYPEVSSKVWGDSFCQLGNSVSLPWVIYYEAFYLHVASSFSCIPVICLKLVLFLIQLQFVHLFSKNNTSCFYKSYTFRTHQVNIRLLQIYRVIQVERTILWEATIMVNVKKRGPMNMCLFLNGYRDTADLNL